MRIGNSTNLYDLQGCGNSECVKSASSRMCSFSLKAGDLLMLIETTEGIFPAAGGEDDLSNCGNLKCEKEETLEPQLSLDAGGN